MKPETIKSAIDKKYTDFSSDIKGELKSKLSEHPECIAYADEIDNIQTMKVAFAGINQSSEE